MLNKKKITWITGVLFIIVLFIGYYFSVRKSNTDHLNMIPSTANFVVLIDLKEIAKENYNILKQKPEELLKLTKKIFKKKSLTSIKNTGFNPLTKAVIYTEDFNGQSLIGLILPDVEEDHFFELFNLKNEKFKIESQSSSILCFYPINNAFAIILNGSGYFIKTVNREKETNIEFAENYSNHLIEDLKKKQLNNSIQKIKNNKNHISIWANPNDLYSTSLNNLFSDLVANINFSKGIISFEIEAELINNNSFPEIKNTISDLNNNELARISTTINSSFIKQSLAPYFPSEVTNLINKCENGICLSVLGFNDQDVFFSDSTLFDREVNIKELLKELTNRLPNEIDVDYIPDKDFKLLNIPDIVIGFKTKNLIALEQLIKADSTFKSIKNGYSFSIPGLLDKKADVYKEKLAFVYLHSDQLIISTKKIDLQYFSCAFNTFYLKINFDKLINEYPANIIQRMGFEFLKEDNEIKKLSSLFIHELEIKYTNRSNNKIFLEGHCSIGNDDEYIILELIKPLSNLIEIINSPNQ